MARINRTEIDSVFKEISGSPPVADDDPVVDDAEELVMHADTPPFEEQGQADVPSSAPQEQPEPQPEPQPQPQPTQSQSSRRPRTSKQEPDKQEVRRNELEDGISELIAAVEKIQRSAEALKTKIDKARELLG